MSARGNHWLFIWAIALGLTFSPFSVRADDVASGFDAANKSYEQGKYAEAASAYDKLIEQGSVSPALYFNRGDALFKMGRLGLAIASYREALRLAPRDRELRANLQFARTRARGGSAYHGDLLQDGLGWLSLNEWAVLMSAAGWCFFILLAWGQWRRESAARLRKFTIAASLATIILGACLGASLYAGYFTSSAIVIVGEADVRNGPLDESPGVFKVRDGTELNVLDQKNGWFQVSDAAERVGWLRQDQVIILESGRIQKPKLQAS